ncbi:MAG TPA: methyltransferase domain-containing protein [Pyrinomonadaceae bacterium]|nr:methyltransferase domain-containing protein [Pyrinomonadaceae bacterium]
MFEISEPEISVEKLMYAARDGARRGFAVGATASESSLDDSSTPTGTHYTAFESVEIQPLSLQPSFAPHADDRYHVNDLLKYHDRNFIQNAYLAILKRGPDATGYRAFIESLRSGRLNKVDVLARLRYSREGRAKRVQVEGLFAPALLRFTYRVPVIGYIARFIVGLARLPALLRHQQQFEAHVAAQQEQLAEHANQIALHLVNHSRATSQQLTDLNGATRKLADDQQQSARAHEESRNRFDNLAARFDDLVSRLDEEHKESIHRFDDLAAQAVERERKSENLYGALKEEIEKTFQKEQEIRMELALQGQRIARLLEELRNRSSRETVSATSAATDSLTSSGVDSHELDALYAALENRFRGTSEEIRERLRVYLPLLKAGEIGTSRKPILDLGCGRGEWLDVLRSERFAARGVDSNSILINECRERGLDVAEDDLMNYLRRMPDAALGALTGFHVIEHMPFETLVKMLDEAVRVLQPGGALIFETPNPQNVLVGSCNFYFDPTHRNPLPAPVMQFLLESRGLTRVEIIKLNPSTAEPVEGASDLVRRFNQYFYGPMDYAIVGWKGEGA